MCSESIQEAGGHSNEGLKPTFRTVKNWQQSPYLATFNSKNFKFKKRVDAHFGHNISKGQLLKPAVCWENYYQSATIAYRRHTLIENN